MSNTVLYSVVIYSIGCVIPTPLDPAPAPTNYSPVLVSATPPFGPITHSAGDAFELSIIVDDPDVNSRDTQDDLHARLFLPGPTSGTYVWLDGNDQRLQPPSVPDPNNPRLRYGTFGPSAQCAGRSGQKFDLYVIVSDRTFDPVTPYTSKGGLTDANHWELSCTL